MTSFVIVQVGKKDRKIFFSDPGLSIKELGLDFKIPQTSGDTNKKSRQQVLQNLTVLVIWHAFTYLRF